MVGILAACGPSAQNSGVETQPVVEYATTTQDSLVADGWYKMSTLDKDTNIEQWIKITFNEEYVANNEFLIRETKNDTIQVYRRPKD